jgi:hypothetical protein
MRPAFVRPKSKARDRIVRWISFVALVALLAMATLPLTSGPRDVAARNTTHWSSSWHG